MLVHITAPALGLSSAQWSVVSWGQSQLARESLYDPSTSTGGALVMAARPSRPDSFPHVNNALRYCDCCLIALTGMTIRCMHNKVSKGLLIVEGLAWLQAAQGRRAAGKRPGGLPAAQGQARWRASPPP